jgi:DNA-binding NtrC family response regulator
MNPPAAKPGDTAVDGALMRATMGTSNATMGTSNATMGTSSATVGANGGAGTSKPPLSLPAPSGAPELLPLPNGATPRVLVVEDDDGMRAFLSECFGRRHYDVLAVASAEEAVERFRAHPYDVVVTDYRLQGMNGLELTRAVKNVEPDTVVVIITAYADVSVADRAIQEGVTDYILKPFNANQLYFVIERSLRFRRLSREHRDLKNLVDSKQSFGSLIGCSLPMRELYNLIDRVSASEATVLVTGESGTGKELIARELHIRSRRKDGPFLAINVAALPESLLESELFGYEPGAFTGADRRKPGLFERARGGTLFLDEVGEMSASMQAKLLRALQEREIMRLGGAEAIKIDVRLVAATNRDLREEVFEKGTFRKDLYYRLNVVPIHVPPLRSRREDIPLLATHFLEVYARRNRKEIAEISVDVMVLLCQYGWPGNVRELENLLERVVTLARGRVIALDDLPAEIRGLSGRAAAGGEPDVSVSLKEAKQVFERRYMEQLLKRVKGNVSEAARSAQVDRPYFYKKIKKYRIEPDHFR